MSQSKKNITGQGVYEGNQRIINFAIIGTLTASSATISEIDPVSYNSTEHKPSVTVTHAEEGLLTEGIDYTISYINNINAGTGRVEVTGIGNHSGTISREFTIQRIDGACSVTMEDFIASGDPSAPVPVSASNGTENVTYFYQGIGNNYSNANIPANAGTYMITATFEATNYNQCIATNAFTIHSGDATFVDVVWTPSCDTAFTYNGAMQSPQPSATGYALSLSGAGINAGNYTATAALPPSATGVMLKNHTCPYAISPKPLQVNWGSQSEFEYNKMEQYPQGSVEDPAVIPYLIITKGQRGGVSMPITSNAGEYVAYAQIISDAINASNYNLLTPAFDYKINRRPLKPYIAETFSEFESNAAKDTLWVSAEIFADSASLSKLLHSLIFYEGFATNTQGESDNAENSLEGEPSISLEYEAPAVRARFIASSPQAARSPMLLSRRTETTQKATAVISSGSITADNYLLNSNQITIIEAVYDDRSTAKPCQRENHCTELSPEVCALIQGTAVDDCAALTTSCLIDSFCITGMLLASCQEIGGTSTASCQATPIIQPQQPLYGRDSSRPPPLYYDLKGTPLGTQKPTAPGVYIEKHGTQIKQIPLFR
ncbi:MAG: hypothetical protein LBC85_03790 [Fibromonadaceae bacterium]|nr:hypothetical protein [Fibromonadaceae bacterium]